MNKYKLLALDESGKASYKHFSELFVLSGIIIPEKFKTKLDLQMRKLKKRFFNDEEIILHSRDMWRKKGAFASLQNPDTEVDFWSRFTTIANHPDIALIFIIVDKNKAKKKGWQTNTILKRSYLEMLNVFASTHLLTNCGKIIAESDTAQDFYLIQAHNRIQGLGTTDGAISPSEYQSKITSLSLVNKSNLDIDIQIADALAPIAGIIYENNTLKKQRLMNKVEKMKKRLIDRKLKSKTNPSTLLVMP